MPAMKRFWTYSPIGLLTFVLGVALYIHFTFGLGIVFTNTPERTVDTPNRIYGCKGLSDFP